MAFFTCIKSSVPILGDYEDDINAVSPLFFTTPTPQEETTSPLFFTTPTPQEETLRAGFSTETVDTLTDRSCSAQEEETGKERSSSQNSTPTPTKQIERFVYEIDPDLGAFV